MSDLTESDQDSLSSLFPSPSTELRQESWINVVLSPAPSIHKLQPGEDLTISVAPVEGKNLVKLTARLIGYGEPKIKDGRERYEFFSVSHSFQAALLDSLNHECRLHGKPTNPLSATLALPLHRPCEAGENPTESPPLTSSCEDETYRIAYALELVGKVEDSTGGKDKKGKGKWKLFGGKLETEKLVIPVVVGDEPGFAARGRIVLEEDERTYPESIESIEGNRRLTRVDLLEPRDVGLATKVYNAQLSLEPIDLQRSSRSKPTFKYTLVASLGQQDPSTFPLFSSALLLASSYAHFVLYKSVTDDTSTGSTRQAKRVVPLEHRRPFDRRDPPDAGLMHRDQAGIIDGVYELVQGEIHSDGTTREALVRFEGEFEVTLPKRGIEESMSEARLGSTTSSHGRARYDLTATFQFGCDHESLVMLRSTNLPIELESDKPVPLGTDMDALRLSTKSPKPSEKHGHLCLPGDQPPSFSSPGPSQSMSQSRTVEDLPAYDDRGRSSDLSTSEEKQQLASRDRAVPSSAASEPPTYASTSIRRDSTARDTVPETEELPPSWDETVRDDMIDDWVAANAVLNHGE
ncbi:hypothetical protein JCM3766R1_000640 [Sporobolomyces carnicolor]